MKKVVTTAVASVLFAALAGPAGVMNSVATETLVVRLVSDPPEDVELAEWKDARPLALLLYVQNTGATTVSLPQLDCSMIEMRTKAEATTPLRFVKTPGADALKSERTAPVPSTLKSGSATSLLLRGRIVKDGRLEFFPWTLDKPVPAGSYDLRVVYSNQVALSDGGEVKSQWIGKVVSNWTGILIGSSRPVRQTGDLALSLDVQPRAWAFPAPGARAPPELTMEVRIRNSGDGPMRFDLAQLEFRLRDLSWKETAKYATMGGLPFRVRGAMADARTQSQLIVVPPRESVTVRTVGCLSEKKGLELFCGEPGKQVIGTDWWTGGALSPESLVARGPGAPAVRPIETWFEYSNESRIRLVNGTYIFVEDLWMGTGVRSGAIRVALGEERPK
jgi:hypothetical protein